MGCSKKWDPGSGTKYTEKIEIYWLGKVHVSKQLLNFQKCFANAVNHLNVSADHIVALHFINTRENPTYEINLLRPVTKKEV